MPQACSESIVLVIPSPRKVPYAYQAESPKFIQYSEDLQMLYSIFANTKNKNGIVMMKEQIPIQIEFWKGLSNEKNDLSRKPLVLCNKNPFKTEYCNCAGINFTCFTCPTGVFDLLQPWDLQAELLEATKQSGQRILASVKKYPSSQQYGHYLHCQCIPILSTSQNINCSLKE